MTIHFSFVALPKDLGVRAGKTATCQRARHRMVSEERASLASSLLLQAGTHGRQERMAVVRLNLVRVPCCYFSIPQSGFHSDWLTPQMNSSSYQSPWRPQEPCCSQQDCLGEMCTDVRLYFQCERTGKLNTHANPVTTFLSWAVSHSSVQCPFSCQSHACWFQFTAQNRMCLLEKAVFSYYHMISS